MLCSHYIIPATLDEALTHLAEHSATGDTRLIAGGTDVMVEIEHGGSSPRVLIDISRLPALDRITLEEGHVHIGPLVTHNQVVASELIPPPCLAFVAGLLGDRGAADTQSGHPGRQPGHSLAGQRHHPVPLGAGRQPDPAFVPRRAQVVPA